MFSTIFFSKFFPVYQSDRSNKFKKKERKRKEFLIVTSFCVKIVYASESKNVCHTINPLTKKKIKLKKKRIIMFYFFLQFFLKKFMKRIIFLRNRVLKNNRKSIKYYSNFQK